MLQLGIAIKRIRQTDPDSTAPECYDELHRRIDALVPQPKTRDSADTAGRGKL
jgi:hypothetical protein